MDYALNALQQAWLLEGDHGGGSHVVAASSVGGGSPLAEVTSLLAKNIGAESPTLRECNVAANKQKRAALPHCGVIGPSSLASTFGSFVNMDRVPLHILVKGTRLCNMNEAF